MKFKIDENLPSEAAVVLLQAGHDATTVRDEGLGGSSDAIVFRASFDEGRALVTLDTDFADARSYPPANSPGVIVLRLKRQDKASVVQVLRQAVLLLVVEPLEGRLWIVDEDRVRIRG